MSKQFLLAVGAAVACSVMVGGCAPTSPRFDSQFGESVRTVTALQILNPDAGSKEMPEAMDGSAARQAVVGYRASFRDPQSPQNAFTIGIGGSGAGGSR